MPQMSYDFFLDKIRLSSYSILQGSSNNNCMLWTVCMVFLFTANTFDCRINELPRMSVTEVNAVFIFINPVQEQKYKLQIIADFP